MRRSIAVVAALAAVFAFSSGAVAHDPPDYLGPVWAWPADHLPVLDANLAEWEVIPEEYWVTEQQSMQTSQRAWAYTGDLDVSSISFRWVPTWNDETNRIYWAFERFDDIHFDWGESIEGAIDGDHSAGTFWSSEGMTDEEAQRAKGRGAQVHHWNFDEGCTERWTWLWVTQADWYDDPAYTDQAHRMEGVPCSEGENTLFVEWYQVYWDDFNWTDPAGSELHDFEVDEIIGLTVHVHDADGDLDETGDDCNCFSRWAIAPNGNDYGNADYFPDFLILPVDETAEWITAVEDASWGRIKASMQ